MFAAETFELVTVSAVLVVLTRTSVFPFTSMYATLWARLLGYWRRLSDQRATVAFGRGDKTCGHIIAEKRGDVMLLAHPHA